MTYPDHSFPDAPTDLRENQSQWMRQMANVINRINQGKTNNSGWVILTANAAKTTLSDVRVAHQSTFLFDPMTANAAAEKAAGGMYMASVSRVNGYVVINHANNAQTDRKFRYIIIG